MKGIYYKKAVVLTLFFLLIGTLILPTIPGTTKTKLTPQSLNGDDWWIMSRHDAANTGCSTSEAPNTNQLCWSYDTNEDIGMSSAAIVEDNVLMITGGFYDLDLLTNKSILKDKFSEKTTFIDYLKNKIENIDEQYGALYCLDAENGLVKWARQLPYPTDPVVEDNKVFVTSFDFYSYNSFIYCLDLSTGATIWQKPITGWALSSLILYENKIYAGTLNLYSYTGSIYCIDATTGNTIWVRNLGIYEFLFYNSLAATEGKVFAAPMNLWTYYTTTFYCLDATTGNYIWTKTLYGFPYFASPVVADGRVFLPIIDLYSYTGQLFCYDILTGNIIWTYNQAPQVSLFGPAIRENELFLPSIGMYSGYPTLSCIDAASGSLIWQKSYNDQPDNTWFSSPSIADEKIYFTADYSEKLICVNANDGSELWSYDLETDSICAPSIADERVIIGDFYGTIYAFEDVLKIEKISGGLFSVKVNIVNEGASDISNIDWEIMVQGGFLGFINKTVNGTISTLSGDSTLKVNSGPLFGIGSINITVTLQTDVISPFSEKATGFILGPIIIIR